MTLHRLNIDNFLERVVQDVVSGDLEDKARRIRYKLLHCGVNERPHQEEVGVKLPFHLVVPLQHASLNMRRHEPVVAARVEFVGVSCDHKAVFHLFPRLESPLVHELAQV